MELVELVGRWLSNKLEPNSRRGEGSLPGGKPCLESCTANNTSFVFTPIQSLILVMSWRTARIISNDGGGLEMLGLA